MGGTSGTWVSTAAFDGRPRMVGGQRQLRATPLALTKTEFGGQKQNTFLQRGV